MARPSATRAGAEFQGGDDPGTMTVRGVSEDCHVLKELMWLGGRVIEVVSSSVASIIGYFVFIRDSDFPLTPQQEPLIAGLFILFVGFAVLGGWMTRATDRDPSHSPAERSEKAVQVSAPEAGTGTSIKRPSRLGGVVALLALFLLLRPRTRP